MDLTKFEQGGPDREVDLDQIWAKWTWSRGGSGPQGEGGTGPGRLELGLGGWNWAWEARFERLELRAGVNSGEILFQLALGR